MKSTYISTGCLITSVVFVTITHSVTSTGRSENETTSGLEDPYGFVIFSVMVLNHADQFPENIFLPTNHPLNEELDKDEFGLLTEAGKMRAYNLGCWTRRRYNTLINGEPYDASLLQMQSSGYDHTVSTGQLFFAGFYPPTDEKEKWHKDINWQPISILSTPRFQDRMILPTESCARIDRKMDLFINSPEIRAYYDDYKMLLDRIREHTELSIPENDDIANIIDTIHKVYKWLRIQKRIGLPIPEWAEEIYPNLHQHMVYFHKNLMNGEILRLKGGPLLSDIIRKLKRKREDAQFSRLFQFYMGHDITIMLVLKMLGVFNDEQIHFCATVLFELRINYHEHVGEQFVITVSYKNSDDIEAEPKLIELPFCSNPCLFDNFVKVVEKFMISPTEWEEECKNSGINYNSMDILF